MPETTSVKLDPSKTWITTKATWALIAACLGLAWVAFDFKTWVTDEIHEVRKEQAEAFNSINVSLAKWEGSFRGLANDVSSIKTALKLDHSEVRRLHERIVRLEAWREQKEK